MKKWTKVVYLFGVTVMLAPNFIVTGTAVAETIDSSTAETTTTSEETKPSETEESKAVDPNVRAAIEENVTKTEIPVVPQTTESTTPEPEASTNKEAIESGKEQNEKSSADQLVTDAQINELKAKLPEGSEVIFENGKLTIKLPAGVEPEVGKQAVVEMGLQVPVEVQAKKSDPYMVDDSYWLGFQLAHGDMLQVNKTIAAGKVTSESLPLLAKIIGDANGNIQLEKKNGIYAILPSSFAADITNKTGEGAKFEYVRQRPFSGPYHFEIQSNGSKKVIRTNLIAGYNAYVNAYRDELLAYLNHIYSSFDFNEAGITDAQKAERYQNAKVLTDYGIYDPTAKDRNYKDTMKQFMENAMNPLYQTDAAKKVWAYNPRKALTGSSSTDLINVKADGWDGMTVSDDVWGVSSAGSALVPTGGIGNLQQLISLVMPQIESILARQVLEDPRALGAKDDAAAVDLPETLSEIVNKSNGLKDIINEFSFTDALNAKVSSDVYKSLRDAIKAVLIEQGVLGAADGWAYVLNQDATLKSAQKYSYTVDSTGQKSTVIALSAGFKLAEKYGTEIKKQAMADALKLDTPVDKEKLFSDLIANSNSVFYKETRLTDEQHGAAAKAALFTLYQEEFKAVKKAVTDYNADPFTDPTVSKPSYKDAVNPYDGSKVEVKDYYYVRVWLYNAGINLVKAGITAADNKSHDELTADLTPITEVPSGVSTDLVQSALDKANSLVPDSLKNSPVLIAEAKKSFVTGYNAEIPRLKKAFENGEKMLRFIADPSNLLSLYGYSGPNIMGVTGNDTLLKGGLFESNKSSTTVKAIYYDNTSVLVPVLSSEPANKAWVDTDKYPTAAEDHRGRATFDGVVKAVRDYAMQYKVVINGYQADDTSIDGQFEAPKDTMDSMLQAENWMRYGIIGDDTVLYMPIIDGYELRDKSAEIVPYITGAPAYKIPVNYDKFEQDSNRTQFTNSFFADGYQKVTFANKRLKVDYVKTMVPAVEGYKDETGKIAAKPTGKGSELTGYDVVGTVRGTNNETVFKPENTVLNFVVNGKPVNAEYKVNADGTFKVHFDKQNLPAGTTSMPASVTPVYTNTYGTKTTGQKVDFTIDVKVDHKTKLAFDKGLTVIDSPLGDKPIGSTLTVPFYWSDTDEGDNLTFKVTDLTTNKEVSLDDATVKVTADVKTGEKKVVIPITAENFKKGDVKFYKIEAFDEFGNNVTDGENQHITFNFIVVEGTLDFKVTTGNKDNMLSWTNRTAQPKIDGEDSYRDSGNTINIAVSDYRPDVSGNWHLTVNAEGTNAAPFYFTWNGQALSNQTIMKPADSNKVDDNNWKQSWDNQSGILLKADQPVKVADYSSTSSTNKAQKIVWTLHNTVDAD